MMDNMENIEKSPGKITQKLDSWFKISERSSTVGSEIKAGLGAFCIAVCALLVNAQVIGTTYGNYAGAYLAVSFIAFAGTLLLGVLCNLPMLQTANMGISSVLISMMGSNTGLTYANLMFVTFIAAIIYLIIVVTPLKKVFIDALPEGVKKAMPVAIGLYVIYTALKNCGLLTDAGTINESDLLKLMEDDDVESYMNSQGMTASEKETEEVKSTEATEEISEEPKEETKAPETGKKKNVTGIMALFLIAAIGGIGGFMYMKSNKGKKKADAPDPDADYFDSDDDEDYLADMVIEEESVSDTEEESPDEDTGEDDQDEMDEE